MPGHAITFDPGNAGAARSQAVPGAGALAGISCPSTSLCVAVDNTGDAFVGPSAQSAPVPGPPTTATTPTTPSAPSAPAITRPSERTAPAISGGPTVGRPLTATTGTWSGTSPIAFTEQWQRCHPRCADIARATGARYTLRAADLGAQVRVVVTATNAAGHAVGTSRQVGPVAPNAAEIKAGLVKQITPHGKSPKTVKPLLNRHGYALAFTALSAGRLTIGWYDGPTRVLVATGSVTFRGPGVRQVHLKVTARGRRLLAQARHLKVTAKGTFTPSGQRAIVATRRFTLVSG
jgi:hypothetical protein